MLRFTPLAPLTIFVPFVAIYVLATVAIVAPSPVSAETGVEIGTLLGVSRLSTSNENEDSATLIGVPGIPSLYISGFPSEQLAIGTEFSFGRMSSDDLSLGALYLGGQGAFFMRSNTVSGPYLLGGGALLTFNATEDDDSARWTNYSAGAGLGYQWRVGPAFLRTEGRYQRWFVDDDFNRNLNQFSLLLGLGTRFGGR